MLVRATPVARTMLRWELRSTSSLSTSFGYGRGHEPRPLVAGFALIAGMALTMPVAPNLVAATFGAEVLRINHNYLYRFHSYLDHRPFFIPLPSHV